MRVSCKLESARGRNDMVKRFLLVILVGLGLVAIVVMMVLPARKNVPMTVEDLSIERLLSNNPDIMIPAIDRLGKLRSEKAIPSLMKVVEDWVGENWGGGHDPSWCAVQALIRIGPKGVEAYFGNEPRGELNADMMQRGAVNLLSDKEKDRLVPILMRNLTTSNSWFRRQTVYLLTDLGPFARAAIPGLIVLLSDKDDEISYRAAVCLARNGVAFDVVRAVLLESIENARHDAIEVVGRYGKEAGEAVPLLARIVETKGLACRVEAARALGEIGEAASSAIPALREVETSGESVELRKAAAEAAEMLERQGRH
jgi:HEAT repeat protein